MFERIIQQIDFFFFCKFFYINEKVNFMKDSPERVLKEKVNFLKFSDLIKNEFFSEFFENFSLNNIKILNDFSKFEKKKISDDFFLNINKEMLNILNPEDSRDHITIKGSYSNVFLDRCPSPRELSWEDFKSLNDYKSPNNRIISLVNLDRCPRKKKKSQEISLKEFFAYNQDQYNNNILEVCPVKSNGNSAYYVSINNVTQQLEIKPILPIVFDRCLKSLKSDKSSKFKVMKSEFNVNSDFKFEDFFLNFYNFVYQFESFSFLNLNKLDGAWVFSKFYNQNIFILFSHIFFLFKYYFFCQNLQNKLFLMPLENIYLKDYFLQIFCFCYSIIIESFINYSFFNLFFILLFKFIIFCNLIFVFMVSIFFFFFNFSFFSFIFYLINLLFLVFFFFIIILKKIILLFFFCFYFNVLYFYQGYDFYFYYTLLIFCLFSLIYPLWDLKFLIRLKFFTFLWKYYSSFIYIFYFFSLWLILDYFFFSRSQQFFFIDNLQFYSEIGRYITLMAMPYYYFRPFFFLFLGIWPFFLGHWFYFSYFYHLNDKKSPFIFSHIFIIEFSKWPKIEWTYFKPLSLHSRFYLLKSPLLPLTIFFKFYMKPYFWIYPDFYINIPIKIKDYGFFPLSLQFEKYPLRVQIPYLTKNILIYNPFFKKIIDINKSYNLYKVFNSRYRRTFGYISMQNYDYFLFSFFNCYLFFLWGLSVIKYLSYFLMTTIVPIYFSIFPYIERVKKPFFENLVLFDYFYKTVYSETLFTKMVFFFKTREQKFRIILSENFKLGREERFGENYVDNIFNPEIAGILQNATGNLFEDLAIEEGYNLWCACLQNWEEVSNLIDMIRVSFEFCQTSRNTLRYVKKLDDVSWGFTKTDRKETAAMLSEVLEIGDEYLAMFYDEWSEELIEQLDMMTPELHETFFEIFINKWLFCVMIFLSFFFYNVVFFLFFFLNFFLIPVVYFGVVFSVFLFFRIYYYICFNICFWTSRIKVFFSMWDLILYEIILFIKEWQVSDEELELRRKFTEDEWFKFFNNEVKDEIKSFTYKFRYHKLNFFYRFLQKKINK